MRLFLIVSLFTIAVLAVCSALVWWAFGLNLSDDQMRRLQNTSAVAQNLGLVASVLAVPGVIILIVEQRRIHEDLARRPKLFVGFDSDRHSDGTLTATGNEKSVDALFLTDNLYSEEVCFYFVAVNIGTRSARDLIWNVDFSRDIQIVERRVGLFRRSYIEGADRRILFIMQPYLHRYDAFRPEVFIRLPLGVSTIDFNVHVWYSDGLKMETTKMRLNVSPKQSTISSKSMGGRD